MAKRLLRVWCWKNLTTRRLWNGCLTKPWVLGVRTPSARYRPVVSLTTSTRDRFGRPEVAGWGQTRRQDLPHVEQRDQPAVHGDRSQKQFLTHPRHPTA